MAFSKSNKFLKIIVGIMLICCILMLFWPKSGNLVLIGKLGETLLIFLAGLLSANAFLSHRTAWKKNIFIAVLSLILILFSMIGFVSMASDLASGPKTRTLEKCHVEQRIGIRGLRSTFLIGYDETGNRVRIRISANDGQTLTSRDRITVSYYEKSSRLIEFVGTTPIQ